MNQLLAGEKMKNEASQEQYQKAMEECQANLSQLEHQIKITKEKHGEAMQKRDVEIIKLVRENDCFTLIKI